MVNNYLLAAKLGGGDDPKKPDAIVTSEHMKRWNNLIDFAKSKGYSGQESLDHDPNLRNKVFAEYNKANPDQSLSQNMVRPIQNEIQNYKQKAIDDIKNGRAQFPGKPEDFMKGISQVDGIFGQKTSSWQFPSAYIQDKATGEKTRLGFANNVDMTATTQPK